MKRCLRTFFMVVLFSMMMCSTTRAANDYYRQLNETQKGLYRKMFQQFIVNHDCDFTISEKKSLEKTPVELIAESYRIDAYMAYSALVNDHPDFFWSRALTVSYTGGNLYQDCLLKYGTINEFRLQIAVDKTYRDKHQNRYLDGFADAVYEINKSIGKSTSKYKKLIAIHQYLCKNTRYDLKNGVNADEKYAYLHNAYGVFVKKKAVCDGYSFAMKELCDFYKIPCMIIYGKAKNNYGAYENHVWNIVKIKKKWYMIDCTWDDSTKSKKWFLCGKKRQVKTHQLVPKHADVLLRKYFSYPKISKKNYKK